VPLERDSQLYDCLLAILDRGGACRQRHGCWKRSFHSDRKMHPLLPSSSLSARRWRGSLEKTRSSLLPRILPHPRCILRHPALLLSRRIGQRVVSVLTAVAVLVVPGSLRSSSCLTQRRCSSFCEGSLPSQGSGVRVGGWLGEEHEEHEQKRCWRGNSARY